VFGFALCFQYFTPLAYQHMLVNLILGWIYFFAFPSCCGIARLDSYEHYEDFSDSKQLVGSSSGPN